MPKAKNLKTLREKANLTQEKLSIDLGVTKSTINRWENAKNSITAPNTRRIAEYFGVSYEDFCNEDFGALDEEYAEPLKLTAIERQNIALFRELPEDMKHSIRQTIIQAHKLMKGAT